MDERCELASCFISEANLLDAKLREAIANGTYENAYSILHALKGMCMQIGAQRVTDMCHTNLERTM